MKVVVFGAAGTIGYAVVSELKGRHEVIAVGKTSGNHQVDMADHAAVENFFAQLGKVDAVVSAAGGVHFGPLGSMTPDLMNVGLRDKLMGQVNLVLVAPAYINSGGSITLIAGTLSNDPVRYGSSASLVNGAIESFGRAAAIELPPGVRINVVSPSLVEESLGAYGTFFPGTPTVPAKRVAMAFLKSVEGAQTGQVYRIE
ncbi:MAG: short chain dehydrogenase [Candidatus Eremiobacteraeota bacterium]|nr:short chain dehydrogenase [Candidatus Eremiobacteraeota bacterium]